ncbi:MAG: hypothetical protein K1Y02_25960 [Candidatus Hydrogenedentes bacterium]|nr:hypothetical protein [Candidatus Hydrogenedentota bacterium]
MPHSRGLVALCVLLGAMVAQAGDMDWPTITSEQRAGAYWWWMGSAVDKANITREMERYHAAGMGGVHIIPIYGAKGYESRYIEYLSPQWMEMMGHAVAEGKRLGMWVDMTTGTGWCFGGPNIPEELGCAKVSIAAHEVPSGQDARIELPPHTQAVASVDEAGHVWVCEDVAALGGAYSRKAADGKLTVYVVSLVPTKLVVERAAPGGEGLMMNAFSRAALDAYLPRFDEAFRSYAGPKPRAMYHDSYEYNGHWAPELFSEFAERRRYRLEAHLPALTGQAPPEEVARIKCDYRETLSDMLVDDFIQRWAAWARDKGIQTRNQAHGSPGHLLDLYGAVDIPETEMFNKDRDPLVAKFASSAAHVLGKQKVAAETATWLREHFTERLADVKDLVDELFVSGVNHVVYHGTCYSPDDAPWPGWLFYASTEMNPRSAIWHDAPILNEYIARCQAVLQSGASDNDILVYWPIHDYWQRADGMELQMTVHKTAWLTEQPIGKVARELWERGYTFDYISDRQLAATDAADGMVRTAGNSYRVVLVPPCTHIPVATMQKLLALAEKGATILFVDRLPDDVPGWNDLDNRRAQLKALCARVAWDGEGKSGTIGNGRVLVGSEPDVLLEGIGIARESLVDTSGMHFIRRGFEGGRHYFVTYRAQGDSASDFEGWLPLATPAKCIAMMDPMTGLTGVAKIREAATGGTEVYLQLHPGESTILRVFTEKVVDAPAWVYLQPGGESTRIDGTWDIAFVEGGPELPASAQMKELVSWTTLGGEEVQRFAGTGLYSIAFALPKDRAEFWKLDLGHVAESARVKINGRDVGGVIIPPFEVLVPAAGLKPEGNQLEIEVTNVSANRIRDLDRRHVEWRIFNDINFVNMNYKPFDASGWEIRPSGLLGPVTLTPMKEMVLAEE